MFSFGDVRAVENLPEFTNVSAVASRDPKMTRLLARIRILPADAESNLDVVIQTLKNKVPKNMDLKSHTKEPIAFGLNAIIGDFLLEDAEGEMNRLEDAIRNIEGVGEIEVINISRHSVKIK
jgi:elongation factor 1-beta